MSSSLSQLSAWRIERLGVSDSLASHTSGCCAIAYSQGLLLVVQVQEEIHVMPTRGLKVRCVPVM